MKFSGKNVVRSYAKWFGIDLLCAVKELSLCGVAIDPAYVDRLKTTFASRTSRRAKQPAEDSQSAGYGMDWDENFAYIAGRTEAGFPYGITWEELVAEAIVSRPAQAHQVMMRTISSEDLLRNLPCSAFLNFSKEG